MHLADHGLRLNVKKIKYMEACPQTDGTINIDGEDLKKADRFKYLGSMISGDGDILPDVQAGVNAAWMKWRQATDVLCNRRMPDHLKVKIYKTVVCPVALYGWCQGLAHWDQVMNEDVRKRLGIAPITEKMHKAQLRWYGHVLRSGDSSVAKTAMRLEPGGQRPRGRPKNWWMDRIKEDALGRAKWRRICRKADPAMRDKR
ncbi:uncharacterized protein LOC113014867 [Astatotilapia calliptera]|uniref:uncharacterized protein LOC113014867 n=1 Tax=Astatotilapia calliptera TaxID=8154 RepID=UPI000E409BBE|nr:uncharacterized protein LOC113014867 [Astatotilapia calliptera]